MKITGINVPCLRKSYSWLTERLIANPMSTCSHYSVEGEAIELVWEDGGGRGEDYHRRRDHRLDDQNCCAMPATPR